MPHATMTGASMLTVILFLGHVSLIYSANLSSAASKCEFLNKLENEEATFTFQNSQCFSFLTNPNETEELLQFQFFAYTSDDIEVTMGRNGEIPTSTQYRATCINHHAGVYNGLSAKCKFLITVPSSQFGMLPYKYLRGGEAWVIELRNKNYYFGATVVVGAVVHRRELTREDNELMVEVHSKEEQVQTSWSRLFTEISVLAAVIGGVLMFHNINGEKYKKMMDALQARQKQIEDRESDLDAQQNHIMREKTEASEKKQRERSTSELSSELSAPLLQKMLKTKTNQAAKLEYQVLSLQKQCRQLKEMNQNILVTSAPTTGNLFKSVFTKRTSQDVGKKKIVVDTDNVRVAEKIVEGVGGSFAGIYNCYVDGWTCCMKELVITEQMIFHLPNIKEKFLTEIKLLESLPYHPNITRYLFHREMDDRIQLFTTKYNSSLLDQIEIRRKNIKLLEEATPAKTVTRSSNRKIRTFFTPKEICDLAMQIIEGLLFLHNHDIIHRDLKSDNILVSMNNINEISSISIADFDTAKKLTEEGQVAKTAIGTPGFIAPEVWNAEEYTYKCDVFSFGMVLYELLSLKRPFENQKGNPQFHINDRKVPELQLDMLIENINRAKELGDVNIGLVDEKGASFCLAALVTLYHKCVQYKKSFRPEVEEIKQQLITALSGLS